MSKSMHAAAVAVLLGAAAVPAQADMRWLLKGGFDFGGETLMTVVFTDGSRESIKANEGIYFGAGIAYIFPDYNLETELSIGWKYTGVTASNGDASFSRFPIDAMVFYPWSKVRVGAGVTYHINPKLSGSGVLGGLNVDFDNAVGALIQAEWRPSESFGVGLRYTALNYTLSGSDISSNGVGVTLSGTF